MSPPFFKLFARSRRRPPFRAAARRSRAPSLDPLETLEDRLLLSANPVATASLTADVRSGGTDTLFAISADHVLYRHDSSGWVDTGLGWVESVTAAASGSGNPVAFIETQAHDLFVLTAQGQLVGTGLAWIQSISAASDASGDPVVYIDTQAGDLFAYNLGTGLHATGLAWLQSVTAVTNAAGTAEAFILTQAHDVFTFDPADGLQFAGLHWVTTLSATSISGGTPVAYVVTQGNDLFRFSTTAGLTEIATPASLTSLTAGTDTSGRAELYAVAATGELMKLNALDQWSQLRPPVIPASFSAGTMDRLFISAADNSVFRYDGSSQSWTDVGQTEANGALVGVSQTVAAADGTFTLAVDGTLWQYIGTSGFGTAIAGPQGSAVAAIAVSPGGALYARTGADQIFQYGSTSWSAAPDVGLSPDGTLFEMSDNVTAVSGQAFSGAVAGFSDADLSANVTVSINWGDGTGSTAGQIVRPEVSGFYEVSGAHTYASGGSYTIAVTITDAADGDAVSSTALASVAYGISVQGTNFAATVGQSFSGEVAQFTDTNPQASLSAVINWGDGATTSGQISGPSGGGVYQVSGSHTYSSADDDTITISVLDSSDDQSGSGTATATVTSESYPISVTALDFTAASGQTFSGSVAQFTDADPQASLSATINWGDGTSSTTGVVSASGPDGLYSVSGSHLYASSGSYQVTITVADSADDQSGSGSGLAQVSGVTVPTQTSSNWSGYVLAPGSGVTAVGGSWVVPTVSSTTRSSDSSVWVGIDGWNGATVEQIGTNEDVERGRASYSAWVELYGDESPQGQLGTYYNQFTLPLTVAPGDTIDASVVFDGDATFTFTIQDIPVSGGTPATWQNTLTMQYAVPATASAEWIVEAPQLGNSQTPLANFGSVPFSGAWATIGGSTGSITSFSNRFAVNMSDPSGGSALTSNPPVQSSTPGPYEPGGATSSSFTVTYGDEASQATKTLGSFTVAPVAIGAGFDAGSLAAKAVDSQISPDDAGLVDSFRNQFGRRHP